VGSPGVKVLVASRGPVGVDLGRSWTRLVVSFSQLGGQMIFARYALYRSEDVSAD